MAMMEIPKIQYFWLKNLNFDRKKSADIARKTTAICPISKPILKPRSGMAMFCLEETIILAELANPKPCTKPKKRANK